MSTSRSAPSSWQIIRAISQREIALAFKRRLVKLLFIASVLPPIILTVVILVRMAVEASLGSDIGWDPMLQFLKFQALPVALLALGIGAPSVARDRAEEVMFLYATRPLQPWHYAVGKLLAVAVPAWALMFLPGVLVVFLRMAVTSQIGASVALAMTGKLFIIAFVGAIGYAGVTVGASAATRRGRWAVLIALSFFVIPDSLVAIFWGDNPFGIGPKAAIDVYLEAAFPRVDFLFAAVSVFLLIGYGLLGWLVTTLRVKREMIP
jgi:ABC-type transport system involved in multi-copper enzyme maturation permease subunit